MRASTPRELGALVRARRQDLRLSQADLASRAGVSRPWLVEVEAGHPRAELGKVLALLGELGLMLDVSATQTTAQSLNVDLDALLESHDSKRHPGGKA